MSSPEENKTVVRRFYEQAWNQKDLSILEDTHSPAWIHRDPSNPVDVQGGPQGNRERLNVVMAAFPDIRYSIEDMVAEGEKLVVRFTARGTHRGMFAGIPATNEAVAMQGIIIHRLLEGKIVEDWAVRDTLGLLQQVGAIPTPEQSR